MSKKKLLGYGIISLSVIIIVAIILLGNYTDRLVDPYVRSLLEHTKPMGHNIQYQKIRVNLLQRFIIINEVSMFPDSVMQDNKLKMDINVNDIRLTGFKIWQMLFKKTLIINELLVENPHVTITLPDTAGQALREHGRDKVPKEGSIFLTRLYLEKIIFSGGSFQVIRNGVIIAKSPGINFLVQSISLVKNSKDEPVGFAYGDIDINITSIELHSETGLYDMNLEEFSFTKRDSTIVLNGFRMIPKYDKKEFSEKLDFQNDRFDIHIGKIVLGEIGIQRIQHGEPLVISSILIDSLNADIYRDKNVTFDFNRFPEFYNESFLKIPVPVYIDTVSITNSRILYGELAEEHPVAGSILLEDFRLQSFDLTNQVAEDTIDRKMPLYVQALIMGEGALNLELTLPLEGNLREFECSGSVGAMKLIPLNDMLEPSINMKFNGGTLNRMTFSFAANDNISKGWMEFLYQDLDVVLMKKNPEKTWGFISDVTNWAALSNNPAPGKDLKIVEISHERDKNKGIINYVWKTIQSGLVHTILPIKKYQINRDQHEKAKEKSKKKKK